MVRVLMQSFPHHYKIHAQASEDSYAKLKVDGKPSIESAPPKEFDGPGHLWSPEDLLLAAVVDCFVLSFKAIASASRLRWQTINCKATGTLDKVDSTLQFTNFEISAKLEIKQKEDQEKAIRILKKAAQSCLITSSLKAPCQLQFEIV